MTSACRCSFVISALVLGLLICATVSLGRAADGSSPAVPYDQRTDVFRRLLFEMRLEPLRDFVELQDNPSESLFLMLGNPSCLSKGFFLEGLRPFVERGGAVLIATDMPTEGQAGEMLSELAGVTVTGETLVLRRRYTSKSPLNYLLYNNSEYCPFVKPIDPPRILGTMAALVGREGRPDLFRRPLQPDQPPLQVAANAPSHLKVTGLILPGGIYRLARLPKRCQDERAEGLQFVDEEGPLFAVGGTVGRGRVLVLADHSVFINRMILPSDNGNLEFAVNCLHWLRGGATTPLEAFRAIHSLQRRSLLVGSRRKVLFWDDGIVRTDFTVPIETVPQPPTLPPEPALVAAIDQTIAKLERNDAFNSALLEYLDGLPGGRSRALRYTVYLLTSTALLLVGYRFLWRARYLPESAVLSLPRLLREHKAKLPLFEQRRRALLRLGNFRELGHHLARMYFESVGVPLTGVTPPRVAPARSSRWQCWRANRRIARLWRLARGETPKFLSSAVLKRRLRELEELKTALAAGTMVWHTDGPHKPPVTR